MLHLYMCLLLLLDQLVYLKVIRVRVRLSR